MLALMVSWVIDDIHYQIIKKEKNKHNYLTQCKHTFIVIHSCKFLFLFFFQIEVNAQVSGVMMSFSSAKEEFD